MPFSMPPYDLPPLLYTLPILHARAEPPILALLSNA